MHVIKKRLAVKRKDATGAADVGGDIDLFEDHQIEIYEEAEEAEEDGEDIMFEPSDIVGKLLAFVTQVNHLPALSVIY